MEYLPAFASGMGVLVTICAAVYFVIRKEMDPVRERVTRLEAKDGDMLSTPLGQKVHDMASGFTRHALDDDARFAEIKGLIADGRKENLDNFAELRTAIAAKKGRT